MPTRPRELCELRELRELRHLHAPLRRPLAACAGARAVPGARPAPRPGAALRRPPRWSARRTLLVAAALSSALWLTVAVALRALLG